MVNDKSFNISNILNKVKEKVALTSDKNYTPDIMEFCYSKKYLNLKNIDRIGAGVTLYPLQQIILKCFYRGQPGNENLKLDKDELQYLIDNKMDDILNKYHTDANFRELILVAGRRCVGENTEILLENGEVKTVKELVENNISSITCFGINEESYNICKNPNSEIFFNGIQDVYRVTLNNGSYIDVTDNHPFLTINGWTETKFLKIKDRVATPKILPVFGKNSEVTDSEASLLGYMIGDGSYTQSIPYFVCKNEIIKEHFEECLRKFSNEISMKLDNSKELKIYYRITKKKRIHKPNDLSLFLNKHGLKNKTSHTKFIPSAILKSSESIAACFLRALFSCDGSIYLKYNKRDKNCKPSVTYTSVSEKLTRDVQGLLLRFGIFSILRKRIIDTNFKKNVTAYEININNASDVAAFLDKISFIGKDEKIKYIKNEYILKNKSNNISYSLPREIWKTVDNINNERFSDREMLSEKIGGHARCHRHYSPSKEKIRTISTVLESKTLEKLSNDSILWLPIKNIEYIGKQKTYDISVPIENQHNFIANNIITHNSGKNLLTSVIASYECMRLLECPNGSPFSYYGLAAGNPIYVISIANSADQAKILFTEIKQRMQMSDYFRNKIGKIEMDRIWLKTPEDQRTNKELVDAGIDNAQTAGSVCIMSGHSNSDGLLGKRIFTLLFDEVASFKATSSANSGERLYTALGPATADFKRPNAHYIDSTDGLTKPILDSKIISISSPRGEEGIFFSLWSSAPKVYNRLAFQAKTWKMNLGISEISLRSEFKYMTPSEFAMEFGAEFSGTTGEKFIPDMYVDAAVAFGSQLGLKQRLIGTPGHLYFAHLDPASTSHNYALVILHVEEHWRTVINERGIEKKEKAKIYIVDHVKVWRPINGQSIRVQEVDDYIIGLAKRFKFGLVTYDSWNSIGSIQKLRSKGVSSKCTPFRRQYKMFMYNNLEQLLVNKQLALPFGTIDSDLMINELKSIKRIFGPQGFRIKPDMSGLVNTDDMCDALAGCCAIATETITSGNAKGVLAYLPHKGSNDLTWNIGGANYSSSTWNFLHNKFGKL